MAFDAITLTALMPELEGLIGNRVVRVHQPSPLEIVITMRGQQGNVRLFISAHPERARVHLTTASYTNPAQPPNFCMYLRRHLEGSRLERLTRPESERIIHFHFAGRDELGDERELLLIVETMGRHSNIIVVNSKDNTIMAAIKPITPTMSRYRQVLPGLLYKSPPPQNKLHLSDLTELDFYSRLAKEGQRPAKALLSTVAGLSPKWAEELVARAQLPESLNVRTASRSELVPLWQEITALREKLLEANFEPMIYFENQGQAVAVAVAPLPLVRYARLPVKHFPTMSAALDYYFGAKEKEMQFAALYQSLSTKLRHEIERVEKKRSLHIEAFQSAGKADRYRKFGELLLAHAYQLPTLLGQTEVKLEDWDNPEAEVLVPLDPALTPVENAQRYFHRYTKAKKTRTVARRQKKRDEAELAYLESVLVALEEASTLPDLEEIKIELENEGYIKKKTTHRRKQDKVPPESEPHAFIIGNYKVLVGRNNRQNDRLTLRQAQDDDIWLHTKNIPGSHVIIRCPDGQLPPENVLLTAAHLAAHYSRARGSSNVPVDYTRRRHVRKPSGARPGFVIYDHQRTIYVTPDTEMVKALKAGL